MKNITKILMFIAFLALIGITVFSCDDIKETEPPEYDELREVSTNGRLTITGLSDYEGCLIQAHTSYGAGPVPDKEFGLYAFDQLFHAYLDGEYVGVTENTNAMVIDGQSTLNVFKNIFGSKLYENYNGNDQDIEFHIGIWSADDKISAYGTVTINFTNGIGNGDFLFVNDSNYD